MLFKYVECAGIYFILIKKFMWFHNCDWVKNLLDFRSMIYNKFYDDRINKSSMSTPN